LTTPVTVRLTNIVKQDRVTTPLLLSAIGQFLGQEFPSFERIISELPDEYACLLKRFTRIIGFKESLKEYYSYIYELAKYAFQ
jgi:hypothetical protein